MKGLIQLIINIREWFVKIVDNFWGAVILAASILAMVFEHILSGVEQLIVLLTDMFPDKPNIDGTSLGGVYAFCNTVVPLSELFVFLAVLMAVYGVSIIYRFVKSWLPTVN